MEETNIRINPCSESVGLCSKRLKRIRPWMQKYLDENKLPGATTLAARHGEVVFCESLGFMDIEAKKPLLIDSILRFYSMTQPITEYSLFYYLKSNHFPQLF